ncbi:hypothetical protein [Phormidesmis priestleyi]
MAHFRDDRPLTRNGFAARMNACLSSFRVAQSANRGDRLIQIKQEGLATRADFEALIQRQRQLNEKLRELSDPLRVTRRDRVSDSEFPAKR